MNPVFKRVSERVNQFGEIATFYQYAVADGVHRLLFGGPGGPVRPPRADPSQLALASARPDTPWENPCLFWIEFYAARFRI